MFGCNQNIEEYDTSPDTFCLDHRGYEHEVGVYWQCENRCEICSCDENGDIVIVDEGPIIVSEDCEDGKPQGPQLPPAPK